MPHDKRRKHFAAGFSTVELVVVVSIIFIIAAMAMIQLPATLRTARADNAMREVMDQLRQAREYAIANRRYVQVTFPVVAGLAEIQITQRNDLTAGAGPVNPVLSTVPLQSPMGYLVFGGLPDTPDAYGNGAAIEFGGVNGGPVGGMLFQSDGELVNGGTVAAGAATPINGSVFLGVTAQTSSARAVTVMGTTGRLHGWRTGGAGWVQF